LSADHDDDVLARLRKLTEQLDSAKKSAELTAKEVARAQSTTEQVKKEVRVHDTSNHRKPRHKRKSRPRRKR
jgi:hypothetical protein